MYDGVPAAAASSAPSARTPRRRASTTAGTGRAGSPWILSIKAVTDRVNQGKAPGQGIPGPAVSKFLSPIYHEIADNNPTMPVDELVQRVTQLALQRLQANPGVLEQIKAQIFAGRRAAAGTPRTPRTPRRAATAAAPLTPAAATAAPQGGADGWSRWNSPRRGTRGHRGGY